MATTTFTKKTLGLESVEPAVTPPQGNPETALVKKPKLSASKSRKRDIPEGKPEIIQSSIGFYFTDEAPTNTPFKIGLQTYAIDIPAGAADHVVRDSYILAADVEVLSVLPHAHFLGKRLEAVATLHDGQQHGLLHIANWDFNWQGDYQFQKSGFPSPRHDLVDDLALR